MAGATSSPDDSIDGSAGATDGSVLGRLRGPAPGMDEVQAFDFVVERINRVVARYTSDLVHLRAADPPDPDRIAAVHARRTYFLQARAALRATDTAQVQALLAECTAILQGPRDARG